MGSDRTTETQPRPGPSSSSSRPVWSPPSLLKRPQIRGLYKPRAPSPQDRRTRFCVRQLLHGCRRGHRTEVYTSPEQKAPIPGRPDPVPKSSSRYYLLRWWQSVPGKSQHAPGTSSPRSRAGPRFRPLPPQRIQSDDQIVKARGSSRSQGPPLTEPGAAELFHRPRALRTAGVTNG
jgi:hypothetical protein